MQTNHRSTSTDRNQIAAVPRRAQNGPLYQGRPPRLPKHREVLSHVRTSTLFSSSASSLSKGEMCRSPQLGLPVPDEMASYRGRGPASPRRYKTCTATPRSHHAGCSAPIAFATASSPTTFLLERPEDQAQRREVHGASCPRASVVG
jgi:hypothetical protein